MGNVVSLLAYKIGRREGREHKAAVRFAANIAREMIEDGDMVNGPAPAAAIELVKKAEPAPYVPDYSRPDNVMVGEKRGDGRRDVAEVAKLVRKDIAAAVKAGELPKAKYGVRIKRFSGGCSLDVSIAEVVGMEVANKERARRDVLTPHAYYEDTLALYSDEFMAAMKTVERIVAAYNRENIDTMSDYFDVDFYAHVSYRGDALEKAREAVRAEAK